MNLFSKNGFIGHLFFTEPRLKFFAAGSNSTLEFRRNLVYSELKNPYPQT